MDKAEQELPHKGDQVRSVLYRRLELYPDGNALFFENERGVQLFAENPGGAPANVLAMAARLGGKTAFIGKVGRDAFGDFLRGVLVCPTAWPDNWDRSSPASPALSRIVRRRA